MLTPDEVMTSIPRLLAQRWRTASQRARRALVVTVLAPLLVLMTQTAAYADGGTAPSALSWIKVKDSHGVSIWQYELSLDQGGIRHPIRAIWAWCIQVLWEIYRGGIALACWLVDWTLSMKWLTWIAKPVMGVGAALQDIVGRFGAVPTFLTIAACVAVMWMAKGRWVLGIFELFMSLIIASLAVGVFANPVGMVAGPDGLLMNSRDAGMAISAGISERDATGGADDIQDQVTGLLAETFLRKPHQLVNFGKVLDGTKCESAYDKSIKKGPYGDEADLREAVGECDEHAKEIAENPNSGMFLSAGILMPAGFIAVLFAGLLCFAVLIAGVYALYQSLKMIVALVMALLPGGARGSLWMTFAEVIIAMVTIIFSIVFLTSYLLVISSVFSMGKNPMASFFIGDVMLLAGIVVFWKGRQRIKASAERLAAAMAKRPGGGGATRLPQKMRINASDAYYKGRMAIAAGTTGLGYAAAAHQGYKSATGKGADLAGAGAAAAARPIGRAWDRIRWASQFGADNPESGSPPGDTPGSSPSPGRRLQERLALSSRSGVSTGTLVRFGGAVAMAAATGGASAAVSTGAARAGAHGAAAVARRAALQGRLRPPQLGPGTSRPDPTRPGPRPPGGHTGAGSRGPAPQVAGSSGGHPTHPMTPSPTAPGAVLPVRVVPGQVIANRPIAPSNPEQGDAAERLKARLAERGRPRALGPGPSGRQGTPGKQ